MANTALFDKKEHNATDAPADGPLFQDIDGDQQVTEIESLCMNCHENGMTRLLLTRVPHFREVIIMAFDCPHCGYRSNELQQANAIAVGGAIYTCHVTTRSDLNRQLVKTDTAIVKIPEIDFEIPAQRGHLTTIEGLLQTVVDDLESGQPVRKHIDEALYHKINDIIEKLQDCINNKIPFTIILDDPAGNSYIESLDAPKLDSKLELSVYMRTRAQERAMGLSVPDDDEEETKPETASVPMPHDQQLEHAQKQLWEAGLTETDLEKERESNRQTAIAEGKDPKEAEIDELPEVLSFPANCSSCNAPSDTKMHILDIPHFKEVIIMSTTCDECGYKSNEVKAGGPVSEYGKRIILKIEDAEDMSRDILKSETCGLSIPEIDLELNSGTLGGRFTTVEGLLRQVHDELSSKVPNESEDEPQRRRIFTKFLDNLEKVMSLEIKSTLILDDPLGNSYLQNLYAPEPDPAMTIEEYKRTFEQNEALGLNDIRLEGYEDHHSEAEHDHSEDKYHEEEKEMTEEQKEADEISGTGVSGGH
ncbi:ZPR1 zinc-finger domain-containing protein [Gamsiella multidivaricata]|uniref:ZPR1 zinc-finger domain-containing protein n=1 Tax=Gamsiella multidivaricata TaxID=101098 RepID=UPI00221E8F40|nr:ZPR1 zinc-finger domain-containing protein [Gamsiella multidivaricata]KAI7822846.1 ZPR1 zinc-finger domain-containing protein [Gamsiella multidivaricata]